MNQTRSELIFLYPSIVALSQSGISVRSSREIDADKPAGVDFKPDQMCFSTTWGSFISYETGMESDINLLRLMHVAVACCARGSTELFLPIEMGKGYRYLDWLQQLTVVMGYDQTLSLSGMQRSYWGKQMVSVKRGWSSEVPGLPYFDICHPILVVLNMLQVDSTHHEHTSLMLHLDGTPKKNLLSYNSLRRTNTSILTCRPLFSINTHLSIPQQNKTTFRHQIPGSFSNSIISPKMFLSA